MNIHSRTKHLSVAGRRNVARDNPAHVKTEPKIVAWLPTDDYLLINSVVTTCNLSEVYHTVRFAHFYTEQEIEARWHSLLFDKVVSSTALEAISRIPPIVKSQLDRQVPFSSFEDSLLVRVGFLDVFPDGVHKSLHSEDLQTSVFTGLLQEHSSMFYTGRDELDLFRQWSRLQTCHSSTGQTDSTPSHPTSATSTGSAVVTPTSITGSGDRGHFQSLSLTPGRLDPRLTGDDNSLNSPLGGDPGSFSDTELLLAETVSSALQSGMDKLREPSTAARRRHMLSQLSYHGFQAQVTDRVLASATPRVTSDVNGTGRFGQPGTSTSLLTHGLTRRGFVGQSSVAGSHNRLGFGDSAENLTRHKSSDLAADFESQRRKELARRRRRLWARLRRTAEEAKRWTRLVEIPVTKGLELTDNQPIYPALAALSGSRTRFLIKEKEVTFGRSSVAYSPHIDLALEGDASRVSRRHGRIRMADNGTFWLTNFSPHVVYVNASPILTEEEVELPDLATIVIARLTFRFDVNRLYVSSLRRDPCEPTGSSAAAAAITTVSSVGVVCKGEVDDPLRTTANTRTDVVEGDAVEEMSQLSRPPHSPGIDLSQRETS